MFWVEYGRFCPCFDYYEKYLLFENEGEIGFLN